MVPKLARKGTSFKGAAAYYLHDKGASTRERVAWTATANLATENPETAWRIMAATAKEQSRLKEEAGIRATGRKSVDVVLAYSLAWHPDEKASLSREDMLIAARASISALNADHCQALIVAHNDEPHPHVHIILNRVSPADGRMLPSSNEKLNLSRWAEAYERGRGAILCEERVANNAARDKLRQFTRGEKDKTRNKHEADKRQNGGPLPRESLQVMRIRQEQRVRDAALAAKGRAMSDRHRTAWDNLRAEHRQRRMQIITDTEADMQGYRTEARERGLAVWRLIHKRHFAELRLFEQREQRLSGKIHNAIAAIKSMGAVRGDASARGFLGAAFGFLTSSSNRSQALSLRQESEKREYATVQRRDIKAAMAVFRAERREALRTNLRRLDVDHKALNTMQRQERQSFKEEWRTRNAERHEAQSLIRASHDLRREITAAFTRVEPSRHNSRER